MKTVLHLQLTYVNLCRRPVCGRWTICRKSRGSSVRVSLASGGGAIVWGAKIHVELRDSCR